MKPISPKQAIESLDHYCSKRDYKGWDPYDGLNSEFFRFLPFKNSSFARLIWIQFFKRSPINLRWFFRIPKEYNPKGLGLFLTAYCNLYRYDPSEVYLNKINYLAKKLIHLQSKGYSGSCWGYNFDWQSKAFYLPAYTPTVVATSFVAESLLNAYDITNIQEYLKTGISSSDFIMNDLNRIEKKNGFMFSYSPIDTRAVYNASLLGTRILSRVYNYTKDLKLKNDAYLTSLAVASMQNENGSFPHSDQIGDSWRDSFHTAFKLESISEYQKCCEDYSFSSIIERGFSYWIENFFTKAGESKYFDTRKLPIDIHCPSQFFSTMYKLGKFDEFFDLSVSVFRYTMENLWEPKMGSFYYQKRKFFKVKIPYMRWSQAWALYGLSYWLMYLKSIKNG